MTYASGLRPALRCGLALAAALLCACGGDKGTNPPPPPPPPDQHEDTAQVNVDIATEGSPLAISPYIYGSNQDFGGLQWTIRRQGGNRMTGYNWENNFSNAGNDWQHSSDNWLLTCCGMSGDDRTPALVATHFHDQSLAMGAASILTLQMAGFAAADGNGTVTVAQTAPSSRWVRVLPRKDAPFAPTPSTSDTAVYMDEQVNYLVAKYGNATSARGVAFYSLDNEPALWPSTHPRIHPQATGAAEIVARSVELASAVKAVDPGAKILGPALYGFSAYRDFQGAPDWAQVGAGYRWFIDYYLDKMRQAETTAGKRLLDVLDVHWYPEARGDINDAGSRITEPTATSAASVEQRLQAPRTLYDAGYRENSWIGQWGGDFLPLIPNLQQSITSKYPGTKLSITEYNYGGGNHVSGGLAQADALGAFGRYGVYIATYWDLGQPENYTASGFKLYRDYDGQGGQFGNTSVSATSGDIKRVSAWAALDGNSRLHVILINKGSDSLAVGLRITSPSSFTSAAAWGFDASGASITVRPGKTGIKSNAFVYKVPPLSATHLVLQ